MDETLRYILEHYPEKLCQRVYIELAYMGSKHHIEELDGEELAELPEDFDLWPKDETAIN
jgi:hypothetical protein